MSSGVKIKDVRQGNGAIAERGKVAIVHCRGFLRRGDECMNSYRDGLPWRITLGKREVIAGLSQGIEGMREGGLRELIVSPHLAYGAKGAGKIPPNAVLRIEVELFEVREVGVTKPEDFPPGKQLFIFRPGEVARNLAQLQLRVHEDGRTRGFAMFPVPGGTWRDARLKHFSTEIAAIEALAFIESALNFPKQFPNDALPHEQLWADASEKANSITRDRHTDTLCVTVSVYERGQPLCYFAVPESSPALSIAPFYSTLMERFAPSISALKPAIANPSA